MSNVITTLDPSVVSTLIATDMGLSATGPTPSPIDLASVVAEVTLETQTLGSSLLIVSIIDTNWAIQRSGFLVPSQGLLPPIDIEFPSSTGIWWRLSMVDGGNDLTQANLTLTFQDRIIAYLISKWGPLGWNPQANATRAQFIERLVGEVGRGDGLQTIRFVCPAVNQVQPVQTTTLQNLGITTVRDSITAQEAANKVNKGPGLGNGAQVLVKGVTPNAKQLINLNIALSLAAQLGASYLATQALIEALIQESDVMNLSTGSGTSTGILQFEASTAASLGIDPMDVTACVTAFLTKHYYTQPGVKYSVDPELPAGAIQTAALNPTFSAAQVAQATQGSAFPSAYGQWATEAANIMKAGGALSGTVAGAIVGVSDVSQLTRGTADNPDESSWACIQRLAEQVNWSAFSNGDTLYYMDGPTMAAQKPAVYLSLDSTGTVWTATNPTDGDIASDVISNLTFTFDNTAFIYQTDQLRSGKIQKASRIATPQTPSQIQMDMICGILDYRAGDVFVFQDAGIINGRWIVEDATRNCLSDIFTQFTLGPPTAPDLEPQATSTGASLSGNTGVGGTGGAVAANGQITAAAAGTGEGVAQAAEIALASKSEYQYTEVLAIRNNNGTLFGPPPRTMDCSSFATLCYKAAGLPDPNHMNYSPIGDTTTLIAHAAKTSSPQPGDLCFFGTPSPLTTVHVTVFVGNGQSISMGGPGDPSLIGSTVGPATFLGYYHPDVLPGGKSSTTPAAPAFPAPSFTPPGANTGPQSLWGNP